MHAYHCINEDFKYGVLPLVLDYQPDHRDHDDKSSFSSQRLLIHIDFALFARNKYYVIDVSKGGNTKSTPVYQCEDVEPVKEATRKLNNRRGFARCNSGRDYRRREQHNWQFRFKKGFQYNAWLEGCYEKRPYLVAM
ncbi:hypothetical protein Pyn_29196 [Prunus yedoensis var. nudiflora]|uniref:Uncharacterized protein n=1 Tax=Prunus yedoensis var. nudiflora TaxID=2094558 RepID=A0A314UCL0_PRUYE|nr:hypothetical protein Pyn_29196 [Prunus yedoensis var. nudiflora]